jgi:hypothetical protein
MIVCVWILFGTGFGVRGLEPVGELCHGGFRRREAKTSIEGKAGRYVIAGEDGDE